MKIKMKNVNGRQEKLAEKLITAYLEERARQRKIMEGELTRAMNESASAGEFPEKIDRIKERMKVHESETLWVVDRIRKREVNQFLSEKVVEMMVSHKYLLDLLTVNGPKDAIEESILSIKKGLTKEISDDEDGLLNQIRKNREIDLRNAPRNEDGEPDVFVLWGGAGKIYSQLPIAEHIEVAEGEKGVRYPVLDPHNILGLKRLGEHATYKSKEFAKRFGLDWKDVFIKIVDRIILSEQRHLYDLEKKATRETYYRKAVKNAITDIWRSIKKEKEAHYEVLDDEDFGDGGEVETRISNKIMTESIYQSLRKRDSDLIRMKYKEGLSSKEIGEKIGMSEVAVNTQISRIRKKIKREY